MLQQLMVIYDEKMKKKKMKKGRKLFETFEKKSIIFYKNKLQYLKG